MTCLDCSSLNDGGGVDTFDLCVDHTISDFTRESDNKVHESCHRLVQVRKSVPQRLMYTIVGKAQEQLQLLDSFPTHTDEDGACSHTCGDTVGLF